MDKNAPGLMMYSKYQVTVIGQPLMLSVEGAGKLLNKVAVQNIIPADEYLPMMLGTSPLADLYPEFNDVTKLKGHIQKENVFHSTTEKLK